MQSLRRAATRASLTSAITTAVAASAAPRTQSISFALRSANALRCFSVAAPRAFSRSAALSNESQSQGGSQSQSQPEENAGSDATTRVLPEGLTEIAPPSPHCVFVHNYSFDVTRQEMTEAFSKFGDVVQVDMPPRKSFCFVYFKEAEAVNLAVDNVNGTFWHGRRLTVKVGENKPTVVKSERHVKQVRDATANEPTRTLYIGNISYDATDVELNELFSALQNVKDVRVAVDKATGWPRGFAHADFRSVEDAEAGLQLLKEKYLRGRPLRVGFAGKSRSTRDGQAARAEARAQAGNAEALGEQPAADAEKQAEAIAAEAEDQKKNQTMDWNA